MKQSSEYSIKIDQLSDCGRASLIQARYSFDASKGYTHG